MLKPISKSKQSFKVIGLMSGTSLDGLDICLCIIDIRANKWNYKILKTCTIHYSDEMKKKLSSAFNVSGNELTKIDYDYGRWVGSKVKEFLSDNEIKPDFIASHGHTIFHKPSEGYTLQIGKGSAIAAESGIPCICDFRSSDVSNSGQGAPLVPIGDRLLFSEYDICLNLGGFANLSYEKNNERLAFDIGPCNIILNHLAQENGLDYDKNGELGKKGFVDSKLLNELNSLAFYKSQSPKSLGREWVEEVVLPIIEKSSISLNDKLRTLYEHIADQIIVKTNCISGKKILATGGGAHNSLLIHLLRSKSNHSIVLPSIQTIDFKEALIFALLGVLYLQKMPGALSSVTGAKQNSVSGCLYY
ncbi:MAG: anhydro-N-acetylmuramic acid kinase [Bacteroidales bacterium]|nr:anhydro-N-acetylmuramic acid kinase [Bacteroidales bacterium]